MQEAEQAIRMIKEAPIISFDTETSGVDWRKNFPIGYVVCSGREVVYVPVRHGGGGNIPGGVVPDSPTDSVRIHQFEKDMAKAFLMRTGPIVNHNIKFDAHMAMNAEISLGRNLRCTQNYSTLLNEHQRQFTLDFCAQVYGVQAKKGEELYRHIALKFGVAAERKAAMARFWELPGNDPLVIEYAMGDGITTWQLHEKQRKELAQQGLEEIAKLEDRLIWTLFRIERRGIRVNIDYLHDLLEIIDDRVAKARDSLPSTFNERSPVDMKKYLTDINHTDWPVTELGNPSFTEKWLNGFPEGQNIIIVRKWTNLANSFIKPLLENHIKNGRVHATFNQLRADDFGTPARLSCSNPNLQQIPKRDKEIALLFRRAFLPDPGYEFNEADWSQCEPRLFAHYAKEPTLIAGYNKTPFEDVHTIVAKMLGVERDPTAKRMNMGIFTGMYPKTFAEHMGWDLAKATESWNQWHSMFPQIREFQDKAKSALLQRRWIKTILGRKLRLEHERFAYRAVSKIIQGGNADIMKYFMIDIDEMLESSGDKTAHLLASVHDSLAWQSLKGVSGNKATEEIKRRMVAVQEPPFNLRVPFVVEHHKGPNWAAATFGKGD